MIIGKFVFIDPLNGVANDLPCTKVGPYPDRIIDQGNTVGGKFLCIGNDKFFFRYRIIPGQVFASGKL